MHNDYSYIVRHYKVPACFGRRITYDDGRNAPRKGVIVGTDGPHLRVMMDGQTYESSYHPTSGITYGGMQEPLPKRWACLGPGHDWTDHDHASYAITVVATTRSKARYKAFMELSDIYNARRSERGAFLNNIKVRVHR